MSEITLKRRADKIGYRITKGFQHCGGGVSLDQNVDRMPGYMILDQYSNFVIAGTNDAFDYCLLLKPLPNDLFPAALPVRQ